MQKTMVKDDELLYRRVQARRKLKVRQPDGTFRVSSQAFNDRYYRPSVNRAELCNYDPRLVQFEPTDGVVSLVTRDVRAIDHLIQYDSKQQPIQKYNVDVEHVPEPDNFAHAEIYMIPTTENPKAVFHKLIERLAQLASQRAWEIDLQE